MIISNVYYGEHEISRIYINEKLVWRKLDILPIFYDICLNTKSEGDAELLAIAIKEIMSGDFICTVGEENDSNLMPLNTALGKHIVSITPDGSKDNSYIFALSAITGNIDEDVNIELREIMSACASGSNIFNHEYDEKVLQTHDAFAESIESSTGSHESDHSIEVIHEAYVVGAESSAGRHELDLNVITTYSLRASDVIVVARSHEESFKLHESIQSSAFSASVKDVNKDSLLSVGHIYDINGSDVQATVAYKQSTIKPVFIEDCSFDNSNSVELNCDETAYAINEVDGSGQSLLVTSGAIEGGCLFENKSFNLSDVEILNVEIDDTLLCSIEQDINGDVLLPSSGDAENNIVITESHLLNIFGGRIISMTSDTVCALNINMNAHLSDGSDIVTEYASPVQTGTNLYIPQIFATVQNGSNLDFRSNIVIN